MDIQSIAQAQIARHIIAWSHVPQDLTGSLLPTTVAGTERYLEIARAQEDSLLIPLGARSLPLEFFHRQCGRYDSYFLQQRRQLPWVQCEPWARLVPADLRPVRQGIEGVRLLLDHWLMDETNPSSEAAISPFRRVGMLQQHFSALSLFADELLDVLSRDLDEGIRRFYNPEERKKRGLALQG